MNTPTSHDLVQRIMAQANPDKAKIIERYFNVNEGGYASEDRFLGINVPVIRRIAKEFYHLSLSDLEYLLSSEWHDIRLAALVILTQSRKFSPTERFDFYKSHTTHINNWDLVDVSAHIIVSPILLQLTPQEACRLLDGWIESANLWERRIAVVGTLGAVKKLRYGEALYACTRLLADEHHLIHKAVGWILREVGKKEPALLIRFLDQYTPQMARITLNYALEKLPESQRQKYLSIPSLRSYEKRKKSITKK